jgi:hypothetical protein
MSYIDATGYNIYYTIHTHITLYVCMYEIYIICYIYYMCVCICIYTYVCICVYVCYVYVCVYIYMYTYMEWDSKSEQGLPREVWGSYLLGRQSFNCYSTHLAFDSSLRVLCNWVKTLLSESLMLGRWKPWLVEVFRTTQESMQPQGTKYQ